MGRLAAFGRAFVDTFNFRAALIESIQTWRRLRRDPEILDPSPEEATIERLEAVLTGRLMAAGILSEFAGTYCLGPAMSVCGQYMPGGNWVYGMLAGFGGDYAGGFLGFDFVWGLFCLAYYTAGYRLRCIRFVLDVWRVHWYAALTVLLLYPAEFVIAWAAVYVIGLVAPEVANETPVLVWFGVSNGLMEALFLGAAAAFMPHAAKHIAPAYLHYLKNKVQK